MAEPPVALIYLMHLIPYRGQNASHAYAQNMVWQDGSVFIMDNYRAAAWCWAHVVPPTEDFSIFHIDRHTDLLQLRLADWCAATPRIETFTLEQYLALPFTIDRALTSPLFRWDNIANTDGAVMLCQNVAGQTDSLSHYYFHDAVRRDILRRHQSAGQAIAALRAGSRHVAFFCSFQRR